MSRTDFIATFVLQNYPSLGIDQVLRDAIIAADKIYGGAA